jgi:fatty-acyl-CoA synthase
VDDPEHPGSREETVAAMSYVSGASAVPLLGETIGQQLDRTAARFPDRLALVVRQQNVRLTWRQLRDAVDRLAAGFLAIGLETGDRVGIWSPNNAEWVLTQLAAARAGLVLVCINPAYRLYELDHALNKAGCRALVMATAFKSSDYAAMLMELLPELAQGEAGELRAARVPSLRSVVQIGAHSLPGSFGFDDVMARGGAAERARLTRLADHLQFDDPVNIQFTSGTTGSPKGATLTHHNLINNGFFCGETMRYTEVDRLCIPVPLYHCFGNSIGVMACLTHGTAMVFPGEGFDPLAVLQTVEEERCTSLYGVPTMFIAEMAHPDFDTYDLSSLRTGMMAGSPCPIEVMRRAISLMHLREITIGYGMTETSPVSFQTVIEAPLERRVSTVGTIHPHMEAKVIDAEGRIVPVGTPGELCTRGYGVMLGYWEDPERTAQAIDQAGWMHTGDLAAIDADGYCAIVGRLKDMVIRGGENVYPREVEEFLYKHPKIMDVQVFGVPDPKYGEEICAWIRLRDDATMTQEEVYAFCRDRIAHFKVPRHIRFVREFPMTVTGKMQKYRMREAMEHELAGEAEADSSADFAAPLADAAEFESKPLKRQTHGADSVSRTSTVGQK